MQKQDKNWREKVSILFNTCQDEFKKTTEIGKKMLNASKTNTHIKEAYEDLGKILVHAIKEKEIKLENPRVKELIEKIEKWEKSLEEYESDVHSIKNQSKDN